MPRPLIVCAHLPPEYGGAAIAGFRYARRLREAGRDGLLVGPAPAGDDDGDGYSDWVHPVKLQPRSSEGQGIRLIPGSIRKLLRRGRPLWARMWSLRDEFDVVHVFSGASVFNLAGAMFGRLLGKPTIVEMSLVGCDDPVALRTRSIRRLGNLFGVVPPIRYLLFRLAHAHVSKSPALSDAYRRSPLPAERLVEIPYAVDTSRYRRISGDDRVGIRRKLGLPSDAVIALFVGGINPRKGVHRLLEAFRRIHESCRSLHLALVGPTSKYDASYVKEIRSSVAALSDRAVLFEGVAENVHEYMAVSDIYVLPSEREGLPITVLEAMASGLAVIASDIPEISDTQISSGENGLLVEVTDVDALATALESAATDGQLRRRLGRAARQRAEARFSTDHVDRRYAELYVSLASRRTRERA